MKLLSVVIPMYNVEPYIERCLRSLSNQDIPGEDYEIICVNDGSPDRCREVVLKMKKEYDNIILIDQENQGVSMARNKGIDYASGRFMLFIDPDDFVVEMSLAAIIDEAINHNAQVTIPAYYFINEEEVIQGTKIYEQHKGKILTGIEAYKVTHKKGQLIPDSSVGILYESEFINKNKLRYTKDVPLNQDCEFLARLHTIAERCIFSTNYLYKAVSRTGSATRSESYSKEKVRIGFRIAASTLKNFKQNRSLSSEQEFFLNGPVAQFVLLAVYSAVISKSFRNLRSIISGLKESGLRKIDLRGCRGYHVICGRPYNLSPYLGALVLAIYLKLDAMYRLYVMKKKLF